MRGPSAGTMEWCRSVKVGSKWGKDKMLGTNQIRDIVEVTADERRRDGEKTKVMVARPQGLCRRPR